MLAWMLCGCFLNDLFNDFLSCSFIHSFLDCFGGGVIACWMVALFATCQCQAE